MKLLVVDRVQEIQVELIRSQETSNAVFSDAVMCSQNKYEVTVLALGR